MKVVKVRNHKKLSGTTTRSSINGDLQSVSTLIIPCSECGPIVCVVSSESDTIFLWVMEYSATIRYRVLGAPRSAKI